MARALLKNTLNIMYCFFFSKGIALDGHLKDEDVNLASSTLLGEGKSPSDAMGIVISYSLRIKVNCGTLGGELTTDVPFKLMQPAPGKIKPIALAYQISITLFQDQLSVSVSTQ